MTLADFHDRKLLEDPGLSRPARAWRAQPSHRDGPRL